MPISDPIAVSDIKNNQASAVAAWNALSSGNKTFANWKSIFVDGMMANNTGTLRVAPSGDPTLASVPPPPAP